MGETPLSVAGGGQDPPTLLPVRRPDPCALVIFGATGDLARRKLLPALGDLAGNGSLPDPLVIVGTSRSARTDAELAERWRAALEADGSAAVWDHLAPAVVAVPGDLDDPDTFAALARRLAETDRERGTRGNRLFYLATPPSAFPRILRGLETVGLLKHQVPDGQPPAEPVAGAPGEPWARVVIEKPFGRDLESARELNVLALSVADESQIYRIDHYLGKETVQNILVLRFGNVIFEPLWNRRYVDHVQITMAESIGVEGRGAFYEETGVLRDIVQNHLLQVLALCAMEPPVSFDADEIRGMKAQLLRSLRPLSPDDLDGLVVRGQYEGYREEPGVAPDSCTPTFVAMKAWIDNWRWQGVPFYLRAGKGLGARVTEVSFHFRPIPFCLFGDEGACQLVRPNVLTIRIQPDEGIHLGIASKVPGEDLRVGDVDLAFRYSDAFPGEVPDAYARLLLDCMRGDPTLFARRDEVELSWRFVMPILEAWERACYDSIPIYPRGGQGPPEADRLLARDGHRWRRLG